MTNNLWTLVRYIYCIAFLVVFVIFMEAAFHKETIGKQIEGVFLAFIFGIVPMAAMYFVTKEAIVFDTIPKNGILASVDKGTAQ